MELPYRIQINCWGLGGYTLCGGVHECLAELEYLPWSVKYDELQKPKKKAEVNAEQIIEDELFGEDE
jgi:hypothetical protein